MGKKSAYSQKIYLQWSKFAQFPSDLAGVYPQIGRRTQYLGLAFKYFRKSFDFEAIL